MEKRLKGISITVEVILVVLTIILLADSINADAIDKYPNKPITLIVPYGAGSGLDIEVRGIQPFLQKYLGVMLIISNIPGADGRIGLTKAFKAPNDGYTLISPGWPAPIIGELMFNPAYKSLDFTFIGVWTTSNYAVVVNSDTWQTMDELVKAGKTRVLSCGLTGLASVTRVLGESLCDILGIKLNWIPFSGGGEYMAALAGKHIDLVIASTSSAQPLVHAGKARPLMVIGNEKDSVFPQAPIGKELGYQLPELSNTRSILAPPGTSLEKIKFIETAMIRATNEPTFKTWLKDRGMEVTIKEHQQFRKEAEENYKLIQKYVYRMGLTK